jgi:hypothetical protein
MINGSICMPLRRVHAAKAFAGCGFRSLCQMLCTGNAAYYVPYMEALYDGFGGRASVRGVSNLGQCSRGLAGQVADFAGSNPSSAFNEYHWRCIQR